MHTSSFALRAGTARGLHVSRIVLVVCLGLGAWVACAAAAAAAAFVFRWTFTIFFWRDTPSVRGARYQVGTSFVLPSKKHTLATAELFWGLAP